MLADQDAGNGAYYVLVSEDGSVVGRFNMIFDGTGTAVLGYRMAERATGQGVATAPVREICRVASEEYGVRTVRASTTHANRASQRVLLKAGFVPLGPADPADVGGKAGTTYMRDVTTSDGL